MPGGLSFLMHGNFEDSVKSLNDFPMEDRPSQVNAIFQFYHLMVALGMTMIGLSLLASFYYFRGQLFNNRLVLKALVVSSIMPQLANQFGWFAAEMGRQPWVVYGHLRTSEAFSESVSANQILFSIILFFIVYSFLLALFIYMLNKKIKTGPNDSEEVQDRPLTKEISDYLTGE